MIAIMSGLTLLRMLSGARGPQGIVTLDIEPGATFFRQGDPAPVLPVVVSGEIELVRWTADGRAVRMHRARAGESFAEASIFAGHCHCDARATVASTVEFLPRSEVLRSFAETPALVEDFAGHLAQSLVAARRLIELRSLNPLSARVMAHLEALADATGQLSPDQTLSSIADDLGVTAPALYRTLATLERSGRIARPRRGRVKLLPTASS